MVGGLGVVGVNIVHKPRPKDETLWMLEIRSGSVGGLQFDWA